MPVPVIMGVSPIEKDSLGKGCMSTSSSQFETIITGLDSHLPEDQQRNCFWSICCNATTGLPHANLSLSSPLGFGLWPDTTWHGRLYCCYCPAGGAVRRAPNNGRSMRNFFRLWLEVPIPHNFSPHGSGLKYYLECELCASRI